MANFYGNDSDDSVSSIDGFANYYGGDGNDLLQGDQANEELYGGAGNDALLGGDQASTGDGSPGNPFVITVFCGGFILSCRVRREAVTNNSQAAISLVFCVSAG